MKKTIERLRRKYGKRVVQNPAEILSVAREIGKGAKRDIRNKTMNRLLDVASSPLSYLVSLMAETGAGTDACLEKGCLPMRVHFYSPVPDIPDLEARQIWDRRSDLAGIDFREDAQLALMKDLGARFGGECVWPDTPSEDPAQFFMGAGVPFSFGCAAALHSLIRAHRPRRVIELGSGSSSTVISAALALNGRDEPEKKAEYTIVDPYPGPAVQNGLPSQTRLIADKAELLDITMFDALEKNDLFFVDSGHVVKIGGDVNFAILEVLPRLKPGVIVHFHDIPLPYEYPKIYYTGNPSFRVFWTESYLLQAFLTHNDQYEVLLGMCYLMTAHFEAFEKAFPHLNPSQRSNISGSFWIRRK